MPNQPMKFPDQPSSITEDDLIAHTFRSYMNESANPGQIALFAMTKAAVRAMDTVQNFLRLNYTRVINVEKFIVSGMPFLAFL